MDVKHFHHSAPDKPAPLRLPPSPPFSPTPNIPPHIIKSQPLPSTPACSAFPPLTLPLCASVMYF